MHYPSRRLGQAFRPLLAGDKKVSLLDPLPTDSRRPLVQHRNKEQKVDQEEKERWSPSVTLSFLFYFMTIL